MRFKFIILYRKKLMKMFLEKLVLGIDLAMAEGKSVKLAGDYNLNYFAKRDRSLLQSVISPNDHLLDQRIMIQLQESLTLLQHLSIIS